MEQEDIGKVKEDEKVTLDDEKDELEDLIDNKAD